MADRAFITGISGFIGRALAARLKERGLLVSGLAHTPAEVAGCRVTAGEIVHPAAYAPDLSRAQLVVHLAAPTTAGEINAHPLDCMKTNWRGTSNVLDCFRGGEGLHFVLISSGKVYGRPQQLPINEGHPLHPETVLGKAKLATEELVRFYAEHCGGKRFTIVRLFNAYGPGQKAGFLIPTIMQQADKAEIRLGDVASRRDFIFIDDVVEAIMTVLFNPRDPVGSGNDVRVFNAGSSVSHSPEDIVHLLEEVSGRKLSIIVDSKLVRSGEAREERADVGKLQALGWTPRIDLKDGLEQTWRAYAGG
jgi:nucleoside-diphosphate-sugar epimerase